MDFSSWGSMMEGATQFISDNISSASDFIRGMTEYDETEERPYSPEVLGVGPHLIEAVENLCNHPNTWKDLPDSEIFEELSLTPLQECHVKEMLVLVPKLRALKDQLRNEGMTDSVFWGIYFVLVCKLLPAHFSYHVCTNPRSFFLEQPGLFEWETDDIESDFDDGSESNRAVLLGR
eukprot:CAMPEP_0201497752 /NCGR_PEP_ID=MMETSP0151_2-20130828/67631_1 /ASSEMBLY_ACC=CAM_ASM_000257 /TAXON_ID=200890 /ORGANISM="Paramoeba atlantica, Strain 621/1 / CCAP 1560/9" /LENGTH=176 /DNA_ID=CAMNT_0047888783 /DNA_START=195 /DNA_END=722 /DNA_ORIENTATION=-